MIFPLPDQQMLFYTTMDPCTATQGLQQFYIEAQRICDEAQFIIDSLPNVELPSAERAVNQLSAILNILSQIDNSTTTPEEIMGLMDYINKLLDPLEQYVQNPPPHPSMNIPTQATGSRGQPSYVLDLPRALELHALGNSWKEIAEVLGVARRTLYYHMKSAGLSTARKQHTEISDDDLDELVHNISINHPFVGSTIVQGHLEAMGVHIGRPRV